MHVEKLILIFPMLAMAARYDVSGKLFDSSGKPVFGAEVRMLKAGLSTSTNSEGAWQLSGTVADTVNGTLPDTIRFVVGNAEERILQPVAVQSGLVQVMGGVKQGESTEKLSCLDVKVAPQEQGKYARQSISHLGDVLLRGNANALRSEQIGLVNNMLRGFHLPRFDDNALPPQLARNFMSVAQQGGLSNEGLASLIDVGLLPNIKAELDRQGLSRAADLRSEFQKNSSVNDKMKTVDVTGDQLLSVMNSAWIYIPVVDTVVEVTDYRSGMVTSSISMSVLWYRMECDSTDGKVHAKLKNTVTGVGVMAADPRSGINSFQSAVKSCVRDLLTHTKEIPEFNLSGQAIEAGKYATRFDIGKNQGVSRNDQYLLVENVQDSSGTTTAKAVGWTRVYARGDSDAYARIVSGDAYPGLALKEAALSNWSLEWGLLWEPLVVSDGDTKHYDDFLVGGQMNAHYLTPWWYGFAFGVGMNVLGGEEFVTDLKASVRQSIPVYKNLSFYVEPSWAIRFVFSQMAADNNTCLYYNSYSGQYYTQTCADASFPIIFQSGVTLGLELALAPNLNLRAGWETETIYGDYNGSRMKPSGQVFNLLLEWTPRGLAVDPLDLMTTTLWSVGNNLNNRRR